MNVRSISLDPEKLDGLAERRIQYGSGVKDRLGNEVYTGDFIKTPAGRLGLVQFALGLFGVNWDYRKNLDPVWRDGQLYGAWGSRTNLRRIDDGFLDDCEVVGNMFENPDLLLKEHL